MGTAAKGLYVLTDHLAAFEQPSGQCCADAGCITKETKVLVCTVLVVLLFPSIYRVSTNMDISSRGSPAHRELHALDHFKQPCTQYLRRRDKKCALFELLSCQRGLCPLPAKAQTRRSVSVT